MSFKSRYQRERKRYAHLRVSHKQVGLEALRALRLMPFLVLWIFAGMGLARFTGIALFETATLVSYWLMVLVVLNEALAPTWARMRAIRQVARPDWAYVKERTRRHYRYIRYLQRQRAKNP